MPFSIQVLLLLATTLYQVIATCLGPWQQKPPGTRVDVGGYGLHTHCLGQGGPTVVIDHSLGGVEGYFLIDEIAKLTKVFIYDQPLMLTVTIFEINFKLSKRFTRTNRTR
jgi:hypothetical protein